jgi:DNA polymerase
MRYIRASGPTNAQIALIGEAPGADEEAEGKPFVGYSGKFLDSGLNDAGILRSDCFVTNVSRFRPKNNDIEQFIIRPSKTGKLPKACQGQGFVPFRGMWVQPFIIEHLDALRQELELVSPNVAVPLGNIALWVLTGQWKITDWAGCVMESTLVPGLKVIPNYHPAAVTREYSLRFEWVQFLRTIKRESGTPNIKEQCHTFHVRPHFSDAVDFLQTVLTHIHKISPAIDIETRKKHIACIGVSLGDAEAMCIPLMCVERSSGYWSLEEETVLIDLLSQIMKPRTFYGQNFLYDAQYIARYWGIKTIPFMDTMLAQHVCFPGLSKGLDFLVKMYSRQPRFWKNESKEWDKHLGEEQLWTYNCKDCVYTREVGQVLDSVLDRLGLRTPYEFQMHQLYEPCLEMMLRGTRQSLVDKAQLSSDLGSAFDKRVSDLAFLFGHPVDPRSHVQLKKLFYHDFAIQPIINRKTHQPTVDSEALGKIAIREPLLSLPTKLISQCRTIGIYKSTFVDSEIEHDRIHTSFNPSGAYTIRWTSSTDAFGYGTNLQNVPRFDEEDELEKDPEDRLPNIRCLFVPDPGYIMFDADLSSADMWGVAWEADELKLKQMLREGVKIAKVTAKALGCSYHLAKVGGHGTNYGGKARTMAQHCGVTVHEMEIFQRKYFAEYPGILKWHKRVQTQIETTRCVVNPFGYRWFIFDRVESVFGEALAWTPQSLTACVINRGLVNIHKNLKPVQLLLQVHDSLVGQYPIDQPWLKDEIQKQMLITVPYPDPLVIPSSIKTSEKSWGDCK